MGKNRRYGTSDRLTRNSPLAQIDLSAWPAIDEGALEDERRKLFLRKKHGITLYLSGASASQIKQSTGFSIAYVYRMVTERCLETHEDGQLYGWRGIIPHARLRPYTRLKRLEPDAWGKGSSGALQLLFASESGRDLERRFERLILRKFPQKPLEGERKPKQDLIVWFLEEAARLSPEARASWPFTAAKQGQVTISKHIDKVLERHPDRARAVLGGPEATRKARAGDGTNRPVFRPFQRVECDAYKTDTRCVVLVPSHAGGWEPVLVHRIWVIVIIEVSARCVLGYAVSVRREPSADDVLRAIKCALTQWSPRKLSFSEVAYVPGGGLPSFLGSKYRGACWDEFSVDGALANICPRVEKPLSDTVRARIIKPQDPNAYSSRRSLDDRPFIETFFRKFRQLHKLSPSTGSKPADRKYRKPEAAAQETLFQLEYLEDLLDVVIANYNATPHTGLSLRSPLRQLEYLCSKPDVLVRQADPGEVRRLLCPRKRCMVHASEVSKTGAYVNFFNARYSAEWLRNRMDLAGEYVWIYLEDDMDARYVTASTLSGIILGGLKALPPWHQSPHTLYMRSAIRSLDSRKIIHLSNYVDPIYELVRAAEENPDKKLAAHPAYLESRRVFAAFANRMQSDLESTDHVKMSFHNDTPTPGNVVEKVQTKKPDIAAPHEGSDSLPVAGRLPPRRKGINLGG